MADSRTRGLRTTDPLQTFEPLVPDVRSVGRGGPICGGHGISMSWPINDRIRTHYPSSREKRGCRSLQALGEMGDESLHLWAHSKALRMNLAARQKLVRQLRSRLLELAQETQIEVCNYHLVQVENRRYGLAHVSESMLTYQNLFTQVNDAKKNGPKAKATFGNEALEKSMLEIGYTYADSLGVVLLAPAQRDMFQHGALDASIDAFFNVVEIDSRPAVRQIKVSSASTMSAPPAGPSRPPMGAGAPLRIASRSRWNMNHAVL